MPNCGIGSLRSSPGHSWKGASLILGNIFQQNSSQICSQNLMLRKIWLFFNENKVFAKMTGIKPQ